MEEKLDSLNLAPVVIGKLLNIGGMLQRHGDRLLLPFNLNQQQFTIFFEIAKANKVRQKDIVNRLMLEKAHISKVVKKLQDMGLITVAASGEDKRSFWLLATEKGKQVINECMMIFEEWNKEWLSEIDDKQLALVIENLTLLQSVFKSKTDNKR
ncbi:MAG: MarR family winged helix-turn-helix transcriptional regulator [Bacteroidales bacterium]|jgi:DNA-binding MarR family transcriptional regulator|nr:MarR family winged helix-turn-helix transcriptional regulator [Bacteroidales bacterium]